jgi:hypothetical protein
MRVGELFAFIKERHAIYERRAAGAAKPWTEDPIFQRFKFCNVYRELDTVTRWITVNWRDAHQADPQLWFALAVARYINWPDTLEEIGYPVPWRPAKVLKLMKDRAARKEQVFTGAYFINSLGPKYESVVNDRLSELWANRKAVTANLAQATKLADIYAILIRQFGFGSFMVGQVIADLKYASLWQKVSDWHSWAVSGPGSRRGLNRVCNRPVRKPWKESVWLETLHELGAQIAPLVRKASMLDLHAQDLQGCLCEYDKYERVHLGEGKPRSLYPGLPYETMEAKEECIISR